MFSVVRKKEPKVLVWRVPKGKTHREVLLDAVDQVLANYKEALDRLAKA